MKRVRISLAQIAATNNLQLALYKAAKGKRYRPDVRQFLEVADVRLAQLSRNIMEEQLPYGRYRSFQILDPKPRVIHAACFEDRIFHHALMNLAGPILERAMVDHSYACRPGKGVHRAVKQVQQNLRRFPYYTKIDIAGYFASIPHQQMLAVLMQRFKSTELKQQFLRILQSFSSKPGFGLPIGSLTSQYFANYYLDGLDRKLQEDLRIGAMVRYMDDVIWWGDDRAAMVATLKSTKEWLWSERELQVKPSVQIQRSAQGVSYCGFRITQGAVRLSRRRKRSYQDRRAFWEQQYTGGKLSARQLQMAYASVHAITSATESRAWRQHNLNMHPPLDV